MLKRINYISCVIGAILLGLGICSPALGRVNNNANVLVSAGLILVCLGLWADHIKELKDKRRH